MEAVLTNGVDCVTLVTEIPIHKGLLHIPNIIRTYTNLHIKRLITTKSNSELL
jgi:hypothetical protein